MHPVEAFNVTDRGLRDGPVMVFAHGFGCDQNMWRHVAPQFEDWEAAAADGARAATWRIETKGVPVSTSGTSRLESTAGGAVQHIAGRIKVSVPLIGGRLERFVYDQAYDTLNIEHDFGRRWLTAPS